MGPGTTLKFLARGATRQPVKPFTERKKAGVGIGLWEEENKFKFRYAEFQESTAFQVGILRKQTNK